MFSNQAVYSLQTKLLRTETNKARADEKNVKGILERASVPVHRCVDEKFRPPILQYLSLRGQKQTTTIKESHPKKLQELSEMQDRPLGKQDEGSVKPLDDVELPEWEQQVLALGPKHPVRDEFNETQFLVDIVIFFLDLKNREVLGKAICEIEAVTKAYANRLKQTPSEKGVQRARNYLKSNGLVAVPYDKFFYFCVMRKDTCEGKLSELLDLNQFS